MSGEKAYLEIVNNSTASTAVENRYHCFLIIFIIKLSVSLTIILTQHRKTKTNNNN